jgi:hypothetical protein
MTGEHVANIATAEDFWVTLPNVGIILAYQQQERRHAYDQTRPYEAKHRLCDPYTPSSVHIITLRSPNTAEILPATRSRVSTMPTLLTLSQRQISTIRHAVRLSLKDTASASPISVSGSNSSSDAGSAISPYLRLPPSMGLRAELFFPADKGSVWLEASASVRS